MFTSLLSTWDAISEEGEAQYCSVECQQSLQMNMKKFVLLCAASNVAVAMKNRKRRWWVRRISRKNESGVKRLLVGGDDISAFFLFLLDIHLSKTFACIDREIIRLNEVTEKKNLSG